MTHEAETDRREPLFGPGWPIAASILLLAGILAYFDNPWIGIAVAALAIGALNALVAGWRQSPPA